jgi:MFS family permease
VPLTVIGLFAILMLPWALKFLWAPLLDKYYCIKYGKRKSWYVPAQILMILLLGLIFYIQVKNYPILLFVITIFLLIITATHNLATNAYIIEQSTTDRLRFGNYAQVVGTALGSFIGGGLFLIIYARFGWQLSVLELVIVSCVLLIIQVYSHENNQLKPLRSDNELNRHNNVNYFINFFKTKNTRYLLYLCLVYRGCEGIVMGMQQPFLVDQHITADLIGKVMGTSQLTLGLLASGIVTCMLNKYKESSWLLILGILRSICYVSFYLLSYFMVKSVGLIFLCVVINMACRSMEMVVLYTFFMKNCKFQKTATDIAILICCEIMIYSLGMMLSGYLVIFLGYSGLFLLGSILSIIATIVATCICRKIIFLNIPRL